MNIITFATTQMNLINCAEYVSTQTGHKTLVVDSVSCSRKRQMLKLLEVSSYRQLFDVIIYRKNSNVRILDTLYTIMYHIKLFIISKKNKYNQVVSGNYLCCGSRLSFSFLSKDVQYIACDDGTGTIAVANNRKKELESQVPMMYAANRIVSCFVSKNPQKIIPRSVTFFTNYNIVACGEDVIIKHNYNYLKQHLSDFQIDSSIFNTEAIVLGEPLYFKNFVSAGCYSNKLQKYAETVKGRILYYAHPEETKEKWSQLNISESYIYINNFLPFEVIAAVLPEKCRIVSFISSVITNIKSVSNNLTVECIKFEKEEVNSGFDYDKVLSIYNNYKKEGVKFYLF